MNLLGLCAAFTAFLVVMSYVRFEYGFDQHHSNKTRIFQLENMRGNNVWESNFARPNLERIFTSSPHILAGGIYRGVSNIDIEMSVSPSPDPSKQGYMEKIDWISPGFTEVFHFEMLEGSVEALKEPDQVLIPQSIARKYFGRENAVVGENIADDGTNVLIAGIFKDIHYQSLHRPVKPLGLWVSQKGLYRNTSPGISYAYVKLMKGNPRPAIDHLNSVLKKIDPSYPSEIHFLDASIDNMYRKSHNQGLMVTLFSLLAILLSVTGVFGLVIFDVQSRTREIGIRKIMGATVGEILVMFNKGFVKIVLICFVVAVPLAWYGVKVWLENFVSRIPVYFWVFPVALLLVLVLTVSVVTFQCYRATMENPAKAIKRV